MTHDEDRFLLQIAEMVGGLDEDVVALASFPQFNYRQSNWFKVYQYDEEDALKEAECGVTGTFTMRNCSIVSSAA